MTLVSVIMPVFNGERYLAETIESILAQTFIDFEFIIVDDGSHDSSAQIIRAYQNSDKRIRLLCLDENTGISRATNHGIANSRCQYIALTDQDDISLPDRLQMQVDRLNAVQDIAVLGTCAYIVDENLKRPAPYDVASDHASIALAFFVARPFAGNTVMLRREAFDEIGLMNSEMDSVQDMELLWRAVKSVKCANLPDRLLLWRRHENALGMRRDATLTRRFRANMLRDLWNEAPDETLQRFERLRSFEKFGWRERRLAKHDMKRVVDALVAKSYVDPGDLSKLYTQVDRRLESMTPRLWQMFCHWRRHRLGRGS